MSVSFNGASTYIELLERGQPRSISSREDAVRIQEQIDLFLDKSELTDDEEEYLSLLGDLVLAWEKDAEAWPRVTPTQIIRELLNANEYKQAELVGSVFPTASVASEVLMGKRGLTYEHVQKLARFFHVSPAVFFTETEPRRSPPPPSVPRQSPTR